MKGGLRNKRSPFRIPGRANVGVPSMSITFLILVEMLGLLTRIKRSRLVMFKNFTIESKSVSYAPKHIRLAAYVRVLQPN